MACHYAENVYTAVFTPREYQVELLDTSREDNTIVCLGNNNAKVFVSIKLLQELASEVRRLDGRRSVFLLDAQNVNVMSSHIRNLTDLSVGQYCNTDDVKLFTDEDWQKEISAHQVLVMTSEICLVCIKCGYFKLNQINLLVIDDCRLTLKRNSLRQILKDYSLLPINKRPRILGLTTTVLCKNFDPARLEAEFEYMEKLLHCTVDTSSDIVTVLRYCSKPSEKVIICANPFPCSLTEKLEMCVANARIFIDDHRYDPFEIYEEEFQEELQDVPDPKLEPMSIFDEFLDILRTLGPWCADRAAFALLIKIENLKVKTPYERHYLLLCMVSTVMVNIRATCDAEFDLLSNESECIYAYSTPRVLRLLQVLRKFKPDTPKKAIEIGSSTVLQCTKIDESLKATAIEKTELILEEETSATQENKESILEKDIIVTQETTESTQEKDTTQETTDSTQENESVPIQEEIKSTLDKETETSAEAGVISENATSVPEECTSIPVKTISKVEKATFTPETIADTTSVSEECASTPVETMSEAEKATIASEITTDTTSVSEECISIPVEIMSEAEKDTFTSETTDTTSMSEECASTSVETISKAEKATFTPETTTDTTSVEECASTPVETMSEAEKATFTSETTTDTTSMSEECASTSVETISKPEKAAFIPETTTDTTSVSEECVSTPVETMSEAEKATFTSETTTDTTSMSEECASTSVETISKAEIATFTPETTTSVSEERVSTPVETMSEAEKATFTSETTTDTTSMSEECASTSVETISKTEKATFTPGTTTDTTSVSEECVSTPVETMSAAENATITLETTTDATSMLEECVSTSVETISIAEKVTFTPETTTDTTSMAEECASTSVEIISKPEIATFTPEATTDTPVTTPPIVVEISTETTPVNIESKVSVPTAAVDDVINVKVCDNSEISVNNSVNDPQELTSSNVPVVQTSVRPWKNRVMRGHRKGGPNARTRPTPDPDSLCAIIFVEKRFSAKILYHLLNELCHTQEDYSFLSVQYTVEKLADPITDSREAEIEHRKQEEVLKKFRMHECNLLIATSVLEEGIDIPKCNLVIRFDQPQTYNSYVQCKGRAKMPEAHYVLLTEENKFNTLAKQLAEYSQIEKMLLKKCKNREPTELEEREADLYTRYIQPYSPENSLTNATVSVATSVALVNKYCAKLPSDTFTRLAPLWWMQITEIDGTCMFSCLIRLPINSPLKQTITGLPMPNRVLARRVAALQACRLLHQMGELDDNLLPVGKESFKAFEDDWNNFPLEESDEMLTKNNLEPRPGTTKRRQYYYKRVADALTDCRPLASFPAYLYLITMTLTCPLPEEQNTRGRKIYPPEDSAQGFGILTLKQIPKVCPFPIFTRSGEVRVGLELASSKIIMTQEQLDKIMEFLNYIFTNVLRLQKYLMLFDPNASENSYFIVPTVTDGSGITTVDWDFLNEIYENRNLIPTIISEEDRKDFTFKPEMYEDAVVMPWYRNQDQPQYFYVAEICSHLNPKSSFPGTDYKTFEEYYFKKYNIQIQNLDQPLLDVDHTSARLNFLTPRYVNRKGVALPTSSEETKRAKRENLEQKQILVPELCTVHPFPASLWRKAVCLPCILYRINALLLADQIRKQVAEELALGQVLLSQDFEWSPLNFGWSLSDVLKKSKENRQEKIIEKSPEHTKKEEPEPVSIEEKVDEEDENKENKNKDKEEKETDTVENEEKSEDSEEKDVETDERDWMEIGTWSNEMAQTVKNSLDVEGLDEDLPYNVSMCYKRDNNWNGNNMGPVRYGSPTSWMQSACFDDYDSDDSCDSYTSEPESSDISNKSGGLRIEFKGDNCAEAIDNESGCENQALMYLDSDQNESTKCVDDEFEAVVEKHTVTFYSAVDENEKQIISSGKIIPVDDFFNIDKKTEESKSADKQYETLIKSSLKLPVIDINSTHLKAIENNYTLSIPAINLNENNPIYEKIDFKFSFDYQPDLKNHPGPSPSVILQALTMSNANDGINLERLETIGDSFLKYAITNYLYSTYDNIHEGKLSHLRSKQVSNLNLYRLGRLKVLGESMIATKFDPHDNWLPPCYYVPKELEQALIDARVPASHWNRADMPTVKDMSKDEICQMVREKGEMLGVLGSKTENGCESELKTPEVFNLETLPCFIPYNLITQHSIPDKSVADCVEALIGAYLIECGPRGALLFMAWLGIRVLPKKEIFTEKDERPTGSLPAVHVEHGYKQMLYGELTCPRSPLLHHCANPQFELDKLLDGYDEFERNIQYHFRDRSYLLQALTHASYSPNTVTDCYQRLEFLGDAVLDYLITRHLYEDPRLHSPGALTDLRSALVNNTIFASLAVRHGFHKYFRHLSPGLHDVVNRFVQIQEENGHSISEEYYLIAEDESEEIEDVEVPKALGDVFESVAGAIFLDSGMSLDSVWRVYYRMMQNEIEQFSTSVPKSPIRELLELEPETAKFGKPEKLADGRRVRVTVEVFGKGIFKGIGRNYRIAKCTAAKCALKQLKKRGLLVRKT